MINREMFVYGVLKSLHCYKNINSSTEYLVLALYPFRTSYIHRLNYFHIRYKIIKNEN